MTQRIANPFPMYFDKRGRPLTGGKLYIGVDGDDPETNPISVFFDEALTVAATQPINIIGGLATNDGNPAQLYVAASAYSLRARDADGAEVFYVASAVLASNLYQPLDSDLTAIAALSTTTFGRGLLEIASGTALRAYAGVVAPLPIAGGIMTGEITRAAAGAYPYVTDPTCTVCRLLFTANGASDPRTQNWDIWVELAA